MRFNCNQIQKMLLLLCNVIFSQLIRELFLIHLQLKLEYNNITCILLSMCVYDARALSKNAAGKVHRRKEPDIMVQRNGARRDLLNCN